MNQVSPSYKSIFRGRKNQRGQILVEYILLLFIAVSCATILVKALVGRGDGGVQPAASGGSLSSTAQTGIIIDAWNRMIQAIGNDLPDCSKQQDFSKPNCP